MYRAPKGNGTPEEEMANRRRQTLDQELAEMDLSDAQKEAQLESSITAPLEQLEKDVNAKNIESFGGVLGFGASICKDSEIIKKAMGKLKTETKKSRNVWTLKHSVSSLLDHIVGCHFDQDKAKNHKIIKDFEKRIADIMRTLEVQLKIAKKEEDQKDRRDRGL